MKEPAMNYHIMIDDKFIDDFIQDANAICENNTYIFTFEAPAKKITFDGGIYAPFGSSELEEVIEQIGANDKVFVHWFTPKVNQIIDQIPASTRVFLCFWGGDFLEKPDFSAPINEINDFLYDPLTYAYVQQKMKKEANEFLEERITIAKTGKNIRNFFVTKRLNRQMKRNIDSGKTYREGMQERTRFLNRLEAVCHWNKFDLELLDKFYGTSLHQRFFIYGVGIDHLSTARKYINGEPKPFTIWLGNSDTETNNHLDAIELLSRFASDHIKIICPLNYGNVEYAQLIAKKGNEVFGDKFDALLDFIPRDEYYALMDETDIAYMPHNRGQAGGNIIAFIKKGKKVIMKEQSSIYQLLSSLDIEVFTHDILKNRSIDELRIPMDPMTAADNVDKLDAFMSHEDKRIKALTELLLF